MLAKHALINKIMLVLITDEKKKDDGSVEGNVVLKTGC